MTGQPTPTHTHIWDGSRDLPDWLTGHHHWHDDQLIIRTPDRYTHPQPGWWLIAWSDGTVTAASPTVAERVYGPDGLRGQLQHAEHEITRHAEAEAADIAAGSYARRVEELQAGHDRIRRLAARIRQGAPWAANFDDLADHIVGALDGEQQADTGPEPDDLTGAYTPDPPIGCLTPVSASEPSGVPVTDPPSGVSLDEARQMRDELLAHIRPTAPTGLRDRLAYTLRTTPRTDFTDHPPNGQHGIGHQYDARCALCTGDVDALTEALHAVIEQKLDAHDEARGQVARAREAIAERRAEVAEYEAENEPSAWSDAVTVTCSRIEDALRVFPEPVGIPCPTGHHQEEQPGPG